MGFLTTSAWACSASGSATLTLTFSGSIRDGDLLFAFFNSFSFPANAWTTPSGWTAVVAQKNGSTMSFGRSALFYKVWRTGDSLSVSSTHTSGGSGYTAVGLAVRSDTDGASVQIGNPPSSGIGSVVTRDNTATSTTLVVTRDQVDETLWDLRLWFIVNMSGQTITPATPAQDANNLFQTPAFGCVTNLAQNPGCHIFAQFSSDPAGSDAGTTNWTQAAAVASYVVGVVLGESGASSGINIGGEVELLGGETPLEAVGLEEIVTVTQGGGGGSITVF